MAYDTIKHFGIDVEHLALSQLKRKLRNIAEVRWSRYWTLGQCSHKHATFSTETQHLSDGPCHLIAKHTQHLTCIENLGSDASKTD
jgi:hypothetical protein